MSSIPRELYCDHALLASGWAERVRMELAADGHIVSVQAGASAAGAEYLGRYVIPGMPNAHSHAFQRAMAGDAEYQLDPADSFWTWRELMYRHAGQLEPKDVAAIAAQLQVEMLKTGFTAVAEFHYLHHQRDGSPYSEGEGMHDALIDAAGRSGIGLTLLPTLYQTGGFGARPASERQRRFLHSTIDFLALLESLRRRENAALRVGLAFHSLRAVPGESLAAVLAAVAGVDLPIHIHIAEQTAEVSDCLTAHGLRPVQWLLANAAVDARWTLVHATHLLPDEIAGIARSGATVAICPTTEANLGDGVFALEPYLSASGSISIGSDSHVSVDPIEELRLLEYSQRLAHLRRNVMASAQQVHVGERAWQLAAQGGARSCGRALGRIEAGARADLLVIDDSADALASVPLERLMDRLVFAGSWPRFRHVMVGGAWLVREFHHVQEDRIRADFRAVMAKLAQI